MERRLTDTLTTIEIQEILDVLPHRYPFLLVDRVTHFEIGKSLKAYKNITFNEPCFTGHFPGQPIFPGVLILEAMAQACLLYTSPSPRDLSTSRMPSSA